MKNFYEATVIKPTLQLDLILKLTSSGPCKVIAQINNDLVFDQSFEQETVIHHQLPINSAIDINLNNLSGAVRIELTIDGYRTVPPYQHCAAPQTDYLVSPGQWSLQIPNFYVWYHQITGQGWIA